MPQIASVQSWRSCKPFWIAETRIVVPAATSNDWPTGMKVTFGIAQAAMLLMRSIASLIIHSGVSLAPMIPTFSFPRSQSNLRSSTFSILCTSALKARAT